MKVRTILLAFGLLFVIGMVMLVVDTRADEVYVVAVPLPDMPEVFSAQAVRLMVEMGWLVPEGAEQLGTAQGARCHEVVTWCGGNSWCRYCKPGSGIVRCACSGHGAPNMK